MFFQLVVAVAFLSKIAVHLQQPLMVGLAVVVVDILQLVVSQVVLDSNRKAAMAEQVIMLRQSH